MLWSSESNQLLLIILKITEIAHRIFWLGMLINSNLIGVNWLPFGYKNW